MDRWHFDIIDKILAGDGVIVHFRQLQAALYSVIMSIGLNTITSHSEMCHSGQIINICKYIITVIYLIDVG